MINSVKCASTAMFHRELNVSFWTYHNGWENGINEKENLE
jgi:hypothetical protein